jgi:hypothetical protein
MSSTQQVSARRRDPLALCAFFLTVLTMVVPVQVGVLTPPLQAGRFGAASLVFALFFAAVFTPFWMSVRRRRREPLLWGSLGGLVATGVILSLDVLWFASVLIYQLFR